jgi:ABC-2 type transport system ATP-binding protein
MYVIEARGIARRYGDVEALTGIDLLVEPGEVVGILGPNGAGKSTAIGVALGLRRPTRGSVRLFGLRPDDRAARGRVGVMLQESGVPASLRVEEVVRLFQSYYPATLPTGELLERAGLQEKRRALVGDLSGGQRQRLYFALALAGDPDLLFLDEPTVGMDVEARLAFWEQVRGLAALGKTVLFTTHYLEEADALATRIVVISRGRIVAEGTPAEVKRLVPNALVRMRTDLGAALARGLPGALTAAEEEGQLVVTASDPAAFLRAVLRADWRVEDLTVEGADLEAAFRVLTKEAA